MRNTTPVISGIALLTVFTSAISEGAIGMRVFNIQSAADSVWTVDDTTFYRRSASAPLQESFSGAYLTGTWSRDCTSDVAAPGTSEVNIGRSIARADGTYDASFSNTLFTFSGSVYAETQLDTASPQTVIAAEGALQSYVYFVVSPGDSVTMQTKGTIDVDGWSSAEFRVTQVFPSAPSVTLLSVRTGGWDTSLTLGPGTYRTDYFASTTNYPLYPSLSHSSYVYSDQYYPDRFSSTAGINSITTFVPEPTTVFALAGVVSSVLLRPRRRVVRSGMIGGQNE